DLIDNYVFLASRTFVPPAGLDPDLAKTQKRQRIHAMLHVRPADNGVVLSGRWRQVLQEQGVKILDYLPHNTFYISLPRDETLLRQLVEMEQIHGISAIQPKDKVAPQLRTQGPSNGRNTDGTITLAVDLYSDVTAEMAATTFGRLGVKAEPVYDNTYHVTVDKWQTVQQLAIQDIIAWIDDLPDPDVNRTDNAQAEVGGLNVENRMGYRGDNITVAMSELALVEPLNHPDLDGRITHGNNPIFGGNDPDELDHAQMVSAIMVADETTYPERAGLLPESDLISYAITGLTLKAKHYGIAKEAREDYGALLMNNSWGPLNCNKAGEYRKRGKYADRAVYDEGVVVVYAAGNARGPNGDFAVEGCTADLYSLPHPVAKNDISVGNWWVGFEQISSSSSAGPAADGRLKPDLVAPGNDINTIGWSEVNLRPEEFSGSGTSAAAPFTSGVIVWLAESFINQGETINDIPPARFKAILVHTAKDVGPSGPDFVHGYGLIQADKAVRIAEEWAQWGHESFVDENTTSRTFNFTVDGPMTFYKATVAWDDEEGTESSSMALKNDLDLTLISPSGRTYYSYDLAPDASLSATTPSYPCWQPDCQDRLNNVEMVMVNTNNVDHFVEEGQWQAVVSTHRLVSNEQDFSLVLTPPCPMVISDGNAIIDQNFTLPSDFSCQPHPLEPSGIIIEADNVVLNCADHSVLGHNAGINNFDGSYVGIRVLGDNATVQNCEIHRFDVGIQVGTKAISVTNALLQDNIIATVGTTGIELYGSNHTAERNDISQMIVSNGKGISVSGNAITLRENTFATARTGGNQNNTVGILIRPGTELGIIQENRFSGGWWYGIRLRSSKDDAPVRGFLVDKNQFEGIDGIPIELYGDVRAAIVSRNTIQAYGNGSPAIHVTADELYRPQNNLLSANIIIGFDNEQQQGIVLWNAEKTLVTLNALTTVATGIIDDNGRDNHLS
ncbi:MAG: S8 family serine peptidase, partial [Caldilineaceae bacterium]|nr:S8 family serine peptidase [Caldilineaceae bacterium]